MCSGTLGKVTGAQYRFQPANLLVNWEEHPKYSGCLYWHGSSLLRSGNQNHGAFWVWLRGGRVDNLPHFSSPRSFSCQAGRTQWGPCQLSLEFCLPCGSKNNKSFFYWKIYLYYFNYVVCVCLFVGMGMIQRGQRCQISLVLQLQVT